MDIKKTGLIKQILDLRKKQLTSETSQTNDIYNISEHGKWLSELNEYKKLVLSAPDIRLEKVKQVKDRLESGFYSSQKVHDALVGSLSSFLDSKEK